MPRTMRSFVIAGASAVLLLTWTTAQVPPTRQGRGAEWLSLSPKERNTYISGYLDGYTKGSHEACLATNDIFEVHIPHPLGDDPAARCESHLEIYSKYQLLDSGPDFSAYTTVITEFYTKHPEYRNIPFFYLIWFLSDSQYKTADKLYQMALKGEIRTNF